MPQLLVFVYYRFHLFWVDALVLRLLLNFLRFRFDGSLDLVGVVSALLLGSLDGTFVLRQRLFWLDLLLVFAARVLLAFVAFVVVLFVLVVVFGVMVVDRGLASGLLGGERLGLLVLFGFRF